MALTKTTSSATDWTAVAQGAIGESATIDISLAYESTVHIQAFLDTTTAHTGTEFILQTSANTTGDEDWSDFCRFTELIGTAVSITITNNPAAVGTTTFTSGTVAADWAVADFPMRWCGIKDGTLANSELMLQTGYTNNTSIVVQDGSTNEHAQNTIIYSIAFSKPITVPIGFQRIRLVINNNYDNNGSTLNYKVRCTQVTAV